MTNQTNQPDQPIRHTGEAANFLNKAQQQGQAKITQANQQATDKRADAKSQAQAVLDAAHASAADVLGQNLQSVFFVTDDSLLIMDAKATRKSSLDVRGTANAAVDGGASRLYWSQFAGKATQPAPIPKAVSADEIKVPITPNIPVPQVSTLRPGEVALYQNFNYEGQMWLLNASVADFQLIHGLNDQISSIRLGPNTTVTLYEAIGFQGRQQTFTKDTPTINSPVFGNDTASSMRINFSGQTEPIIALKTGEVAVYQDANYRGRVWIFNASVADLRTVEAANDQASSIRLGPNTSVTLYDAISYQGKQQTFTQDTPWLGATTVGNDTVSSLMIKVSTSTEAPLKESEVILYTNFNYDGTSWRFNQDMPDFRTIAGLNDQISSVRVGPNTAVTLYEAISYQGRQQTFTADTPTIASGTLPNDTASSMKIALITDNTPKQLIELVTSALDGTNLQRLATVTIRAATTLAYSAIGLDLPRQQIYWIMPDGAVMRCDFKGGNLQQIFQATGSPTRYWNIAIDSTNKRLFWSTETLIGQINMDGSGAKTLIPQINAGVPVAIAVDSKNNQLYWNDGKQIRRLNIATGKIDTLFTTKLNYSALTLDSSTQLLYWCEQSTLLRADMNGAGQPESVMKIPNKTPIRQLAIDTIDEAANDRLIDAQSQRQDAQLTATNSVQQAHTDATTRRQNAQTNLDTAHTTSDTTFSNAQQTSTTKRQQGEQAVANAHTSATEQVNTANRTADQRRTLARLDAQITVSNAQTQSQNIKDAAEQKLNDARRKQQNS